MGICIKDMLHSEFFRNFKLLTGHGGLDNQIQGISIMDAPDGLKWAHGRGLLLTSGYVFYQNPGLMEEMIESGDFKKLSGFAIKLGRFIHEIPDHVIAAFNESNIPLISIPVEYSWIEIINQMNVLVMNNSIRQFNIRNVHLNNYSNLSYQVRKVDKILSQIEKEMNFPAMLFDLSNQKSYYSSSNFLKLANHLKKTDFWDPSFDYDKEILCNNLHMARYRYFDEEKKSFFSWIIVPISVGNEIKAYFVVLEAADFIDYFDQFALRIGFVLLQSLYEQMLIAQSVGDAGFEEFINDYLSGNLSNQEILVKQATEINLDIKRKYYLILMRQTNKDIQLLNYKDLVKNTVYTSAGYWDFRVAIVDNNDFVFLIPEDESNSNEKNLERIKQYFEDLNKKLERKVDKISLSFGIFDKSDIIFEIDRNYSRCKKAVTNGKLLFPSKNYFIYSELGAFAWMDIQEDEIGMMYSDLKDLFEYDENKELIETLKVYLESNMNSSQTANKLHIHNNTVRKRLDQINDKISIDLDEPLNRLKLGMLLSLFNDSTF